MMEPTKLGDGENGAELRRLNRPWLRCVLPQAKMRAAAVVVGHEGRQRATEAGLVEHDDVVQTLAPNGTDHPFDVGPLPWGVRRGWHVDDTQRLHCRLE